MSLYNEFVQEHYRNPRNLGRISDPTFYARTYWDDAMLEFYASLEPTNNTIEEMTFRAIGCAGTLAAGSVLTEWLIGRTVAEAKEITSDLVLELLQGLPKERLYCADFAAAAIHKTFKKVP